MQDPIKNLVWMIYGGTALLTALFGGFVTVLVHGHRNKLRVQEEQLHEIQRSELKYRNLFDHSLAGMMKFSFQPFALLDANQACLDLFDCTSSASLQETLARLFPEHLVAIWSTLEACGVVEEYEVSFIDTRGKCRWLIFSAKLDGIEKIAYAVLRDISLRKFNEEKIQEQAALLNQTRDSVFVLAEDGCILFWNNAASLMYGYEKDEVLGQSINRLLFQIEHDEQYRGCMEDIEHYGEWIGEQSHKTKHNRSILVESSWQKIDNQFTKTSTILVVSTDITEKRALELNSVYNQKMEAIALMTSGIAHDLQNILAPMALSINILREYLSDQSGHEIISKLEDSTANGLSLVRNILWVGKGISGVKSALELGPILEAALRNIFDGASKNFRLEKQIPKQSIVIQGDESQLYQVFLNLYQNAKDAMPGGGRLTVRLSVQEATPDVRTVDALPCGNMNALVEISDTGHGIPRELIEKIYEPFYTTKGGTGGTGLGLPIVKNIIRNHGGMMYVKSLPGEGTTFSIVLPLNESEESKCDG